LHGTFNGISGFTNGKDGFFTYQTINTIDNNNNIKTRIINASISPFMSFDYDK
jgi:hypothetical protein